MRMKTWKNHKGLDYQEENNEQQCESKGKRGSFEEQEEKNTKNLDKSCFQEDGEDQECGGGGGCGVCRARWWKHYEEFTSSWILKRMTIRGEGKGGAQKWKRE